MRRTGSLDIRAAGLRWRFGNRHPSMLLRSLVFLLLVLTCLPCAADAEQASSAAQTTFTRSLNAFPRVGEYEILCCDFHLHTTNSDGKLTPEERVLEAWRYGYDAIAITDHAMCPNYNKSYDQASPLARRLGVVLVRGLESGIENMEHFVALGVSDKYKQRDGHLWAEVPGKKRAFYQDQLREIAAAGGFVLHPHPHVGFREPLRWAIEEGIVQGIEVENHCAGTGVATVENHGKWWYAFAFDWALEHNLAVFANSDAHKPRGEEKQPVTLVFAKKRSEKGILEALRARRTLAWFDDSLCGRKELLSDLVRSMVGVRRIADANGKGFIRLENRGPVLLKAVLKDYGTWEQAVEICPYQEALVASDNAPRKLIIFWDNVLISSKDHLLTFHDLASGT
ncbi:MAG TPA: PHP domain-containing protein [Armatimonadota bacterium]|nr:PHP domain-containing protein [Armatimonadota bacterium]